MTTRPAAVAGMFYPQQKEQLKQQLLSLLEQASHLAKLQQKIPQPQVLICPHAGYIYSGLTAACAYLSLIEEQKEIIKNNHIKRVILLGPAHHVAINGMATPSVSSFSTPLGDIPLDSDEINHLIEQGIVIESDLAHQKEHSLEVQLPFLQILLNTFKLIPIVVGHSHIEFIATLLSNYLNQPENLIIISTDLSHFLSYSKAQQQDQQTAEKIMHFAYDRFESNDACGRLPLAGMLKLAKQNGLTIKQLDLRNSGDSAGDKQRVVGYGAWILY